jgi:hypothetical protein
MKGILTLLMVLLFLEKGAFASSPDFSDWESAGDAIARFGAEDKLKNATDWMRWAQRVLLKPYYLSKGLKSEEEMGSAAEQDWIRAEKRTSRSYQSMNFSLDGWRGYRFLSLSYTNLDFKEQAFGIHFELLPGSLKIDEILNRYAGVIHDTFDEGGEKRLRFTIPPGRSLNGTPLSKFQSQLIDNDELWIDFGLSSDNQVRFVEVLNIKSNPQRVPFTKEWNWDDY